MQVHSAPPRCCSARAAPSPRTLPLPRLTAPATRAFVVLSASLLLATAVAAPAAAQSLTAVVSCPEGVNDPNAPQNPHPGVLEDGAVGTNFPQCRLFLGAQGAVDVTDIDIVVTLPATTLEVADSAFLPGGDLRFGHGTEDITFTAIGATPSSQGVNPGTGTPAGTWDELAQTYTWTIASLTPGQSLAYDFNVRRPHTIFPAGTFEVRVDVTASNAPAVPSLIIETDRTLADGYYANILSVPNPIDTAGNFVLSHLVQPIRDAADEMLGHTNAAIKVYAPYLDGTGAVQTDGAYDPNNPAHVLLIDPAASELRVVDTSGDVDVIKPAGTLTAPNTGSANDGLVIQWVDAGGYFEVRVGLISWSGYSGDNTLIPTVSASMPFTQTLPDGTALIARSCIDSDLTEALGAPRCSERTVTTGPSQPPAFNRYNHHWTGLGAGPVPTPSLFPPSEDNGPLTHGQVGLGRWIFQNGSSARITNIRVHEQVPGHDINGKAADFYRACWNTGTLYDGCDVAGTNACAIHVATTPSDYTPASDLMTWVVPSPTASWTRCDHHDGDLLCCSLDDLATAGINPEAVTEVRFDYPDMDPKALLEPDIAGFTSWVVNTNAPDSIDGLPATYTPLSLDNSSIGSHVRVTYDGVAPGELSITATSEVDAEGCRFEMLGWCNRQIFPTINSCYYQTQTTTVGSKETFAAMLVNWGAKTEVSGPYSVCGTAPVGWEFDGLVTTDPVLPAANVTSTYSPVTRELCVSVTEDGVALTDLVGQFSVERIRDLERSSLRIWVSGDVVPGSAFLSMEADASGTVCGQPDTTSHDAQGRGFIVQGLPALQLFATPSSSLVGQQAVITYDLQLDNHAYLDDGSGDRDPAGSTLPATDTAVFQKVPKDGDYPSCQAGPVGSTFVSASSSDAVRVWVNDDIGAATGPAASTLVAANGWQVCATTPAICDATALAAIGLGAADVQWVAFELGTVNITDVAPRGTAPLNGATRLNSPYAMELVIAEDGSSSNGSNICSEALFAGGNYIPASLNPEEVKVTVNFDCELGGVGNVEVCNGVDDDCDGLVDEGFAGVGDPCTTGTGMCERDSIIVCTPDGMGFECYAPPPCDDGDPCNGAETCDPTTGCGAGPPADCDDGNPCTDDSCSEFAHAPLCAHTPVLDGTPCLDADLCDGEELCVAGVCVQGTPLNCSDGDACNGVETCDAASGCAAGVPVDCDDDDACTTDSCAAATGACEHMPVSGCQACGNGTVEGDEACDDGADNSDTSADACRTDCTLPVCGDGATDSGEACDDGASNSDAMPNACRSDCSAPSCGDGVIDLGEECDDAAGNSDVLVDACRTDCRLAYCRDGIVDTGEECDNGAANSDFAADACRFECEDPRCGDSVIDTGEICDDGAGNSDSAADACRTSCQPATCGDGVLDTGEACDMGAANDNSVPDACRESCEEASCGDAVIDTGEACDDGAANSDVAADACRTSCEAATCGDGVVDVGLGEVCDTGTANSNTVADACRRTCQPAGCGDGVVDSGEACDDGALNSDADADACRTSCVVAGCGDGVVDAGESCDDGAANSDSTADACREGCVPAACGDGVTDTGEACDDANDVDTDDCVACQDAVCGDGIVHDGVEACDEGAANSDTAADACRSDCSQPRCGDGVTDAGEACDDGADNGQPNACNGTCSGATGSDCGNGVVEAGEVCDDGADNSDSAADACRLTCVPATCGDGVTDAGEQCDAGIDNSNTVADACRMDCSVAGCGDGVVDALEECDDGAAGNSGAADACRVDCTEARCGDGVIDSGETCDDGAANDDAVAGACRTTCVPAGCGDGVIDPTESCDDGADNGAPNQCNAACTGATGSTCGNGVVETGEACDDGADNSDSLADACRTTCVPAGCGDGVVDAGEGCDMGPANSDTVADACRTGCMMAGCGDGVVDAGEACDDGAANSSVAPDSCRLSCALPSCGDGVQDADEACDSGAANSDAAPDACRSDCVAPACGDGVIDAGETCDNGADNGLPLGCNLGCNGVVSASCGNGVVEDGEACDDGVANSDVAADACRTDCATPSCGDGATDTGEVCDDGGANGTAGVCNVDCTGPTPSVCGNGVTEAGEGCDDGAANSDTEVDACRTGCVAAGCGDGVVDTGEACDDGADNGTVGLCAPSCAGLTQSVCGDGVVEGTEACDEGDDNSDVAVDGCRTSCEAAGCGDGVVDTGEACDDGADNGAPGGCATDCAEVGAVVAVDDVYWTVLDTALSQDAPGVLANDTWRAGLDASATLIDASTDGDGNGLVLAASGGFLFTPAAGFVGRADFGYATSDAQGNRDEAVVTVWINDPPTTRSFSVELGPGGSDVVTAQDLVVDLGTVDGTDADDADGAADGLAEGSLSVGDSADGSFGETVLLGADGLCAADADGYVAVTAPSEPGTYSCFVTVCEELPAEPQACAVAEIVVTVTGAVCGNGMVEGDEGCDDGNSDNTDSCPDDVAGGGTCQPASCGDGHVHAGEESCDGEGCRADCGGVVADDCGPGGDGVAGEEVCDGLDGDCDGVVDGTLELDTGEVVSVCTCDVADAGADCDDDGVDNGVDLCPEVADADQLDCDGDGAGDVCDPEGDAPGAGTCQGVPVTIAGGGCGVAAGGLGGFASVMVLMLALVRRRRDGLDLRSRR